MLRASILTELDVLVAGGGIAGASAALLVGRAGFGVELYERETMPREKPCGEGLMPGGVLALERWGLSEAVGGTPLEGVRYFAGGLTAAGRFPSVGGRRVLGRGQRRLRLDRVLFEAAASTPGVTTRAGAAVEAPLFEEGRVVGLRAGGEERRARLVVAADGLRSPLRRQLGLEIPPRGRPRVGVRAHFRLAEGESVGSWIEVHVGRGYELYVTPLPERELLVAGLAEAEQLRGGAEAAFARWLGEQRLLARRLRGAERVTAFEGRAPLAASVRAGFVPGCVLLGDAAGYVDPITGGGMTQAMLGAELLARHAPRLLSGDPVALTAFEGERRALLRDYELLTRGVLLLAAHPALAQAAIALLARTPRLFSHLIGVAAGTGRLTPRSRLD